MAQPLARAAGSSGACFSATARRPATGFTVYVGQLQPRQGARSPPSIRRTTDADRHVRVRPHAAARRTTTSSPSIRRPVSSAPHRQCRERADDERRCRSCSSRPAPSRASSSTDAANRVAGALVAGGIALGDNRRERILQDRRRAGRRLDTIEAGDPATRRRGSRAGHRPARPDRRARRSRSNRARRSSDACLDANGNPMPGASVRIPADRRLHVRHREQPGRLHVPRPDARRLPAPGARTVEGLADQLHGGQRHRSRARHSRRETHRTV